MRESYLKEIKNLEECLEKINGLQQQSEEEDRSVLVRKYENAFEVYVDKNVNLDNTQKLTQLMRSLQGEAKELVEEEEDYEWDTIKFRNASRKYLKHYDKALQIEERNQPKVKEVTVQNQYDPECGYKVVVLLDSGSCDEPALRRGTGGLSCISSGGPSSIANGASLFSGSAGCRVILSSLSMACFIKNALQRKVDQVDYMSRGAV
ncbi:unnamed protein product [Enterobius vermicularis]|uniref:Inhibitor of growth protein n=1 Tax=Enterobius vermicularis TaxID=51028 RepID=A0A0N4VI37_ENTVE|nr:unnamed protein product [Enterobius vermicularis]